MANLVVDIGSTAVKASWTDGLTLGKTYRYQGEKIFDFILSLTEKIKPRIMIVSTFQEISRKNEEKLRAECSKLILFDSKNKELYDILQVPEYLSPDRAASVIASRYLFKGKKVTVFDFGTTMTIDFINEDGVYEGGNVSLGLRTRLKALNRYSKSLPLLGIPEENDESYKTKGISVNGSIISGVLSGIIFEINGYLSESPENINVFTGGDAIYFAKKMKISIFAVCNLVLMGLSIIAEKYYE